MIDTVMIPCVAWSWMDVPIYRWVVLMMMDVSTHPVYNCHIHQRLIISTKHEICPSAIT
jgi:hypothetical protein